MKLLLKIVGALVVLIVVFVAYVQATYQRDFSNTPLPKITASTDPEVIAQGEYLAHAVAHCSACHGPAELLKARDPKFLDDLGNLQGGYAFKAGPFGTYYAANITSDAETGIGKLSDGQIARVVRHAVDRDGRFAAFMSFAVGKMSNEDLTALVSYLRTVPPQKRAVPKDEWGPIAKMLSGKFNPRDEAIPLHVAASSTPTVERGGYLATGPAFCAGCHSAFDPMEGFVMVGAPFSGDPEAHPDEFDPTQEIVTPNLTPDPKTGIMTSWSEDQFVERFRAGRVYKGSRMPWENYGRMTDADLRSLYRYLRSVPPTEKLVGPSRRPVGWKPGA